MTGYPWSQGDELLAADLNAAINAASSAVAAGGPFLPLSGGTMLGQLTLAGNATLPLQAVPLQQLNAAMTGAAINSVTVATVTGNAISAPAGTNYIVVQDAVNPVNSLTVGSGALPNGYELWMAFPNGGPFGGQTVGPNGNLTLKVLGGAWTILSRFG